MRDVNADDLYVLWHIVRWADPSITMTEIAQRTPNLTGPKRYDVMEFLKARNWVKSWMEREKGRKGGGRRPTMVQPTVAGIKYAKALVKEGIMQEYDREKAPPRRRRKI